MYFHATEGLGKPPAPDATIHVHYLVHFGKEGFDTTKEFREAFHALNHYFLKKGKYMPVAGFRDRFCKATHYVVTTRINVHGVAVPVMDTVAIVSGRVPRKIPGARGQRTSIDRHGHLESRFRVSVQG